MIKIISTASTKIILLILSLITSIFSARFLGPDIKGNIFFWTNTVDFIIQYSNLGMQASNIYFLGRKKVNPSLLASNTLIMSAISTVIFSIIILSFISLSNAEIISKSSLFLIVTLLSFARLLNYLGLNFYIGLGLIQKYNFFELMVKAICTLALLISCILTKDPIQILWILALTNVSCLFIIYFGISNKIRIIKPNLRVFFNGFNYNLKSYIACGFGSIIPMVGSFILKPNISSTDFGYWSLSTQLFQGLIIIPTSLSLVIRPRLMRSKKPRLLMNRYISFNLIASSIISILFLFFGQSTINFLFGSRYSSVYNLLIYLLPGFFSLSIFTLISSFLASIGKLKEEILIWFLSLLLHCTISFILLPFMGGNGINLSLSLSYIAGLIMLYKISTKKYLEKRSIEETF